tara:strand:+ start:136 stop:447 length:312 start_codon:yes stop_codon:yes gene_type:complete
MDRYDLKLKKKYAEMRDHEHQLVQKCLYTRVATEELAELAEPEKQKELKEKKSSEPTQPQFISPEHIPLFHLTQTLQSMINIVKTQHTRIKKLEKIIHRDSLN